MPDAPQEFAALWRDFALRVDALSALAIGEGTPADDAQRAAGLRYLTRFLAAGLRLCALDRVPSMLKLYKIESAR